MRCRFLDVARRVWPALVLSLASFGAEPGTKPARALPSGRLNKELPSWLRFSGEERARVEGWTGIGYRKDAGDLFLLNRLRIDLQATPSRWLKFSFQGQDSRVWGGNVKPAPASQKDSLDLRVAHVELGDAEKSPVALRVGRQSLVFGEGRLVADPNWSNTGRTFDAVRATVRHGQIRLDAFAASVVRIKDGEFNQRVDGDNFHGLYGSVGGVVPNATVEPYLFWRLAPRVKGESGAAGKLDSRTAGVRWVGKLPAGFDYGVEVAGQGGWYAGDRIGAWASHFVLGHTFPDPRRRPRVFAEYNHASGDQNPGDGRRGTFDQLYPSPHDKFGLADQFMWSNLRHARGGFEIRVRPSLALLSSYHSFWLASARDGLYAPGAKLVARSAGGAAGSHVGQEFDAQALWTVGRNTQLDLGYARIFPGLFLRQSIGGVRQNCIFVNLAQRF
jgi:hypothetical protein